MTRDLGDERTKMDRRDVLKGSAALAALSAMQDSVNAQAAKPAAPISATGPVAGPTRTLTAAPARRQLKPAPSALTNLWGFDGTSPGPVLRMKQGETLRLRLDNKTDAPLSLHWHGVRQANTLDGVGGFTAPAIAANSAGEISVSPPDSGVFIYRPMVLGNSGRPQEMGLAGMLIVEEREPPQVDHDIALVVDDWLLTPEGQLAPFPAAGTAPEAATGGRLGNWLSVNGRPVPERTTFAPGSRLRLRLANLSNARTLRIRFDNLKAYVIAVDSQPTDTFEPLKSTLPFAPGTRYDIMVDLLDEPGQEGSITGMIGPGAPLFMAITAGEPITRRRAALPPIKPLPPNPALPPAVRLQDALRTELVLAGGAKAGAEGKLDLTGVDLAAPWTLNGKPNRARSAEEADAPLFRARRGQPIVLKVQNTTLFPQPLHIHGHVVRVLHPLDDGWEPYFLDTIIIPEGKTLQLAFIADNPGKWLISSTVTERFDTGLWSWFEVMS
ncbi:MAG: multicopper oxidase family protein [Bosea sp. (in: a-proteobacteria)]